MNSQLLKVLDESNEHIGYLVDIHGYKYIPKIEFDSLAPIELFNKFKLTVTDTEVIKGENNV